MNKDIVQGKWHKLKGNIQKKWGDLTDDDLDKVNGSYEKLQGLLQEKYGYQKEESQKYIDDIVKKHDEDHN